MEERYDTALLGILQNEGKVEKFLDVILGFLYRRYDDMYRYGAQHRNVHGKVTFCILHPQGLL